MSQVGGSSGAQAIRGALLRRELASSRFRTIVGSQLGITDRELHLIQYLAQAGGATSTELGELFGLSSGGISALVSRLVDAGYVARKPDPFDKRSHTVELTDAVTQTATKAFAPLLADLDAVCASLSSDEQELFLRTQERLALATELQVQRLREETRREKRIRASPVPTLWG